MTENTVLVLGGTGRTGQRIVNRLHARGIPTRIGSRSAVQPFDWDDPSTWDAALTGVSAAYVCYSPDLAFPGVSEMIADFAQHARRRDVRRLVILSGRGEEGALASEQAIQQATDEWTVVRSSWFAQNFSEHFLLGPVLRGRLLLPAGTVREPFVDLDDLADVATTALVDDGHAGRVYELTGPRLLSLADVADELSRATGRSIEYVPSTPAEFVADVAADGIPSEEAAPLAELFESILDGRNESLTGDLEAALGRPATDFAEYARRAAASGVWDVEGQVAS
ncbi:NmrA family transcriptional regulator [Diaminobutyricimonas sp. TR449]|uniref:NmrA family transcriptional regulator n=1 Tax=Diaminobutyricimonas sp. TR449 TaxID=2708076 RepID=UPI00142318C1|nr:NmrA family transcriptional regulator [Diaminobutyricimonas sp. TR449]